MTAAAMGLALVLALIVAPEDADQGISQRIFYIHVPIALTAYFCFGLGAVKALLLLWRGDERYDLESYVAIHQGTIFGALTLITGAIWAKASWGVWWTWSSNQLVLFLVLFLFYCAYFMLRFSLEDGPRRARSSAVYALFGIALIPWAPLCGGLLTGKYRRDDQSAAGRWQGGKDNFGRPATPAAYDVIEGLVALAKEKGCTPSQLALAWNASQPGITAPIIGPRTLEQLLDNVGAFDVKVTDADRARLDALAPPWSQTLRYYDAALAIDFKPNHARW